MKAVAFSHDGSFIAIAGGRPKAGVMRVIDAANGERTRCAKGQESANRRDF